MEIPVGATSTACWMYEGQGGPYHNAGRVNSYACRGTIATNFRFLHLTRSGLLCLSNACNDGTHVHM